MGFLEKIGLVERVQEPEPEYDFDETEELYEEELEEVNIEGVTQENLIADIYSANELSDEASSIFKVEQLCSTLPNMATDTKKVSVLGMLGVFGLTAEQLVQDATERMNVLASAKVQINNENIDIINIKKQEIEEARKLIENCEKTIAEHELTISESTYAINQEIKRISELNVFLGGQPFDFEGGK